MKDPEFLAAAEKMQLEVDPVSGEEIEKLVTEIYKTSPEAVAAAREAIK
jgi:hypothetical protein